MRIIKLKYSNLIRQLGKITEEVLELSQEINSTVPDREKIISEAWDVIQTTFGVIFILGTREIKEGYKKHFTKLQNRIKAGKIKLDEYIDLEL